MFCGQHLPLGESNIALQTLIVIPVLPREVYQRQSTGFIEVFEQRGPVIVRCCDELVFWGNKRDLEECCIEVTLISQLFSGSMVP